MIKIYVVGKGEGVGIGAGRFHGGYSGFIDFDDKTAKSISVRGDEKGISENKIIMIAVNTCLELLFHKKPLADDITIYTDSSILNSGVNEKYKLWRSNGWKKENGKKIVNLDLWKELDELVGTRNIECKFYGSDDQKIKKDLVKYAIEQQKFGMKY